jgi:hypothetical protein
MLGTHSINGGGRLQLKAGEKEPLVTYGRSRLLGTELSLSSRGRMTLGVGEIFWFISHTLPQCHTFQGVGDTYL